MMIWNASRPRQWPEQTLDRSGMAWGGDMALSHRACIAALLMSLLASQAAALDLDALYSSKAIVTGKGEKNRQPGLRDCLDRVLVKVSGDQRLPGLPEAEKLRRRAGDFVASFSYRDRLAGKPIHDEQGTYDRPHDLTCRYDRKVIDDLLGKLGSRPWLGAPKVAKGYSWRSRCSPAWRSRSVCSPSAARPPARRPTR